MATIRQHSSPTRRMLPHTSVILFLWCLLSAFVWTPLSVSAASSGSGATLPTSADIALVMDNINLIQQHDPNRVRFSAAQLLVDMAPRGDAISVVRIPSSSTQSKNLPVEMLGLQTINSSADRATIKSKLTLAAFGGKVDPGPSAFFVPALDAAANTLLNAHDGNRKYVVLATDTAALSADQENCATPANHLWFCEAAKLESEGISVVLLGFTPSGSDAQREFQTTKQYIESHSGTVLVVQSAGVVDIASVAEQYARLLSLAHQNVFETHISGKTASIHIAAQDHLSSVDFIGLGQNAALTQIQNQNGGGNIAGQNSDTLYNNQGTGYWLQEVNNGNLTGNWQITGGSLPPDELLIVGVSEIYLQLLNPAPIQQSNDASIHLVASGVPTVLRVHATSVDGSPIEGVALIANPQTDSQNFSASALPTQSLQQGSAADLTAIISAVAGVISVGLGDTGEALTERVHLEKTYQIVTDNQLPANLTLHVPASQFLQAGSGVNIQATSDKPVRLALFAQDPNSSSWQQISTTAPGSTSITGLFTPKRGCGTDYNLAAIAEVNGSSTTNGAYDYILVSQGTYTSTLSQRIRGTATANRDDNILPWAFASHETWNITFDSTACTPQTLQLGTSLNAGHVTISPPVNKGGGAFTVAENTVTTKTIGVTIGACPISSLWDDQSDNLTLTHTTLATPGVTFETAGDWTTTLICPSFITYMRGHFAPALLLLFVFSILLVRLFQVPLLPFVPRTHLSGNVEIVLRAAVLAGEKLPDIHTFTPVQVPIPRTQYHSTWYLARRREGTEVSYSFEAVESPLAVLKFAVQHDASGYRVMVAATRYAIGPILPEFHLSTRPVGQEAVPCEGDAIVIDQDLLYSHLNVVL